MLNEARLIDEEGAITTLKGRLAKAPSFSEDMLRYKVFGAYQSDLEFQLVHFASMPLYKEDFDPNAALRSCQETVYVAESHSEASRISASTLSATNLTPRR